MLARAIARRCAHAPDAGGFDIGDVRLRLRCSTRRVTRGDGVIDGLMLRTQFLLVAARAEHIGQIFLRMAVQHGQQAVGQMAKWDVVARFGNGLVKADIGFWIAAPDLRLRRPSICSKHERMRSKSVSVARSAASPDIMPRMHGEIRGTSNSM